MASSCSYDSCCSDDGDSRDVGCIFGWAMPGGALKKSRVIFVLGGPGSGKGTQCDLIVKKYGFTHLSSGDLLREEVASGSDLGVKMKAIMDRGALVPLEMVLELLKKAIEKNATESSGFLIDGYPRELEQGKRFEAQVAPVERVVYFQVSDETMKARIMKRGETSGRSDDNEATVAKRLQTFHANNQPVVDYYNKQKKLCQINAEGTVDAIFKKVVGCIDKSKTDSLQACMGLCR